MIDNIPLMPSLWKSQAGPPVAETAPLKYSMDAALDYAVFSASGTTKAGSYPGAEWYITRPIPTTAKSVCHRFLTQFPAASALGFQTRESDLIFTGPMVLPGKAYKFNRSFQFNDYAKTLEIADKDGNWVPFATQSTMAPDVPHEVQIFHTFDFIRNVSSTPYVVVDGVLYPVPINLQNVPATLSNWTDYEQVIVQDQIVLRPSANPVVKVVGRMKLIWS